mgnify:CR=1 FL=1
MDDLADLYREIIVEHGRSPRNHGRLDGDDVVAREGYNPLCGDRITLFVERLGDRLGRVAFVGEGCAISTASASLLTEAVAGRTVDEAEALFQAFRRALTTADEDDAMAAAAELGELAALLGVRAYPMRVKCATLAWHTLHEALDAPDESPPAE